MNWGKQHRFIDFHEEIDRSAIVDAINNADIVITNFRGNSAEKYGLDYNSLQQNHKALIYCNLTGYGEENDRPAYDIVLQAETGYLSMNGIDEDHLCRMPVALIDVLAAHQMKEAILIALLHKMKTGKGSYLTVSLYDTAIASLTNQATNYLIAAHIPKPLGCKHPNIAPYGDLMHCADGLGTKCEGGGSCSFVLLDANVFLPNDYTQLRCQRADDISLQWKVQIKTPP